MHSPGPWKHQQITRGDDVVRDAIDDANGDEIVFDVGRADDVPLITTAPELLAFVAAYAKRDPVFLKGAEKTRNAEARALVAKATA